MDKYKKFHQQGHELRLMKDKIKQSLKRRMKRSRPQDRKPQT